MPCVKRGGFDVTCALTCCDQRLLERAPAITYQLNLHRPKLTQATTGCVVVPCCQVGLDVLRNLLQGQTAQIALHQHPVVRGLSLNRRQHGKTPLRTSALLRLTKSLFNLIGMNLLAT